MVLSAPDHQELNDDRVVEAEGVAKRTVFRGDGSVRGTAEGVFSLAFDVRGNYLLVVEQTNTLTGVSSRVEIGCDGTNVFEVAYSSVSYSAGSGRFSTNSSWKAVNKKASALIYPVPYPNVSGELAAFVWAMYLGRFFEGRIGHCPAFWIPTPGVNKLAHCFEIQDSGDFLSENGGQRVFSFKRSMSSAAKKGIFITPKTADDLQFNERIETDIARIPDGTVRMVLDMKCASIDKLVIPTAVKGQEFRPAPPTLLSTFELISTTWRLTSTKVSLPRNPGTLSVFDFRRSFDNGKAQLDRVTYFLEGKAIDSLSDKDLDALLFAQQKLAFEPAKASKSYNRVTGLVILAILALLPVIPFVKRILKPGSKKSATIAKQQ